MDKDLEKILNKAKSNVPIAKPEAPKKVFPKNGPYDYLVFTELVRFAGFNKLIFLLLFPGMISIGFLFAEMRIYTLYVLIGYFILLIIHQISNVIRYHFFFKGWQERLPFKLEGWNEMIYEKKMFCDLCWNHCRIFISTSENNKTADPYIEAALKVYCKKTVKAFYEKRVFSSSSDNRNDWEIKAYNIATGSANPEVMQFMKNLLQGDLTTIAKKTGAIHYVKFELTSPEFQIDIQIDSGD